MGGTKYAANSRTRDGTWITLVTPNAKQKEAYSRYCHTLSAAGVIGALTLVFSESPMTAFIGLRATMMFVLALLLLITGIKFLREA